jgi:hypothetical protein
MTSLSLVFDKFSEELVALLYYEEALLKEKANSY